MNPTTIAQWHNIIRTRDARDLSDLLADGVVFFSPVVHKPQLGRAKTAMYLTAAVYVLANGSFRYIREIIGDWDAVLEFETEIDNIFVNGVDMIKWNDEGKIIEFKVMIRPLKAINLIHEKMAELLSFERIEGGSANAHQRLQSWRKRHPAGYLLNVRGPSNTFLHKAGYCQHLGDADWQAGDDHGWPEMGNTTKVLALRKEVLAEWARGERLERETLQQLRSIKIENGCRRLPSSSEILDANSSLFPPVYNLVLGRGLNSCRERRNPTRGERKKTTSVVLICDCVRDSRDASKMILPTS